MRQLDLGLFPKWPRAKPPKLKEADVKAVVRHRDGYRCRSCGMTARQHVKQHGRTLDVHRVIPGKPYRPRYCVTLCKKCHAKQPKSLPGLAGRGYKLIRIPPDLYGLIAERARQHHRSITGEVIHLLESFLMERSRQPPP